MTYAISGTNKEAIEVESKAQVRALIPKIHTQVVTNANGTITVPFNDAILSVQNCDATNSNDAITSWARLNSTTLYYNKSGVSPTRINVVYVGIENDQ